ncbi:MAG: hypothetical protein COV66_02535 [Nitrospinae bacterium CG11_big_fil_rev_8_21_14_0_20_45_15]|nr:MAG: hypothetical protein COV66_02535 [Nitrospinae bacterium CG11_big_fil_rev_8_21_14_0_20_45_15]
MKLWRFFLILYKIFQDQKKIIHATSTRDQAILKAENGCSYFASFKNLEKNDSERNFYSKLGDENKNELYTARQVHGDKIYLLNDEQMTPHSLSSIPADAIITRMIGKPIAVVTADCVPIIIFDPVEQAIAVVHAGRKGTSLRIFSKTIRALQCEFGSKPETLLVALGPSIRNCCYEVGESCRQPFEDSGYNWQALAVPVSDGKFLLDLCAANLEDGLSAGLFRENVFLSEHCTSCRLDLFYSYRREGTTGRMITAGMLLDA